MSDLVACLGEPLVVFSTEPGASMLDSAQAQVSEGGAELNVAVHLARLGVPTRFIGAVGDDVLGRRLKARLQREGIDTSALQVQAGDATGAYVKEGGRSVAYLRRGSAATRLVLGPDDLRDVTHLHLTGITAALSDTCAALLDQVIAQPRPYTVSFDVNHREKLWPAEDAALSLAHLTGQADIVFVGRDEAELLWGTATADEIRELLNRPELVVKDDDREATAFTPEGRVSLAPEPVDIVEPVGAGDAFAAGYLCARLRKSEPQRALAVGHRLARQALLATDDLGEPVPGHEIEGDA